MVWRGWATREEASLALAQVLVQSPAPDADQLQQLSTLSELLEAWHRSVMSERPDLSPWTLKATREGRQRIEAGLGTSRLDRLGRAALDTWVASRQRLGQSTITIHNDLGLLARVWRWGQQVGACPAHDLPLPRLKVSPKRTRYTPPLADVSAVVRALEASAPAWTSIAVRIQAATGCRIGELASLTWDRVDLEAGLLTLQGKTGERVVPIQPDLARRIAALPMHSDWVLGVEPVSARAIRKHLAPACQRAGVRVFTSHALRRLAVDRLARAGVDVGTAAALLGHSPTVMLNAYRQVGLDERRDAAAALALLPRGEVIALAHRSRSQINGEDV